MQEHTIAEHLLELGLKLRVLAILRPGIAGSSSSTGKGCRLILP
jgi:hypothetical protein